ncbi:MAG: response regulator [Sphingobacteriales bacterium]|nr:MAG: response regulator [Sphingobacteriales bacterium]
MSSTEQKILIVDDDSRNIFALKAVLKSKGFSCDAVQSAQEAIDVLLSAQDYYCVLLDMMMPEMDGYEALRVLRSEPETARLKVIAVTAQAMKGDREKCLEAGADEYLSKPVDVDSLIAMLRAWEKQ